MKKKERITISCGCGCGETLVTPDKFGRDRRYVLHHCKTSIWKGKHLPKEIRDKISIANKGGNKTSFKKGDHRIAGNQFSKGHIPWHKRFDGRRKHGGGYVCLYLPEHKRANKFGYVLEHIVVVEKSIGRDVVRGEAIHHINGNKSDNRIENLMLFESHAKHMAYEKRLRDGSGRFISHSL